MLYLSIKVLHIVLVATALGANIIYGVWFARANAYPDFAPIALRGIALIDSRIANPAYILLLPTGAFMVWIGGLGFGHRWIQISMTLWLIAMVVAYAGYTPTLKRQIGAVERSGVASPEAKALSARGQAIAAVLAVLVLTILVLMVFKPA